MYDIVLECTGVCHSFGDHHVICDINLKIVRGEIVALVGPTGSGKSTFLRAILGTHPPLKGTILMNGVPVFQPARDRGIVYQRYSLFPFLTAVQNVAFGLMLDKWSLPHRWFRPWKWRETRKAHLAQAAELLEKLGLRDASHFYPHQMSGGMCQRVALAQTLIMKPEVLLLDEPFGALDEATREEHQSMLLDLYDENLQAKRVGRQPPYTIVLVTHELREAVYVSDRIVALSRYWRWEHTGEKVHPGATIIYDAAGLPFPRGLQGQEHLEKQRMEIREAAFDPSKSHARSTFIRFWRECQEGRGVGIMAKDLACESRTHAPALR